MNKPIVCIYHRADFDGIFCREIAKQFFTKGGYDVEYIGWDYGDPVPEISPEAKVYMLDISVDGMMDHPNLNWVDHHKSALEKFGEKPGYQIDGVAACRLAWQYFGGINGWPGEIPTKEDFTERRVSEPLAVRLAGEYDIWDKRDPRTDIFQFGLRSRELSDSDWGMMLSLTATPSIAETEMMMDAGYTGFLEPDGTASPAIVLGLLKDGELLQRYQRDTDKSIVKHRSFTVEFEGLKFLALNTARCNSLTFESKDVPETGHEALLGFFWNGIKWTVSLYHAEHRKDLDLSLIAVKYGGGGHRGACGFYVDQLPFLK
jgi:uncharacterized protein